MSDREKLLEAADRVIAALRTVVGLENFNPSRSLIADALENSEFPAMLSPDPAATGVGTARANDQCLVKGGGSHGE